MAILANRYLVLLLLFAGAAISYFVGLKIGFWLLIAVGAIFELAFWFEFFIRQRRP
ncbi:MAG: hypothetical protein K0U72_04630 [Gammaproteobacteria bacterium]|nr:hypothetical protein [Gammaproteobacteria bacterium]